MLTRWVIQKARVHLDGKGVKRVIAWAGGIPTVDLVVSPADNVFGTKFCSLVR